MLVNANMKYVMTTEYSGGQAKVGDIVTPTRDYGYVGGDVLVRVIHDTCGEMVMYAHRMKPVVEVVEPAPAVEADVLQKVQRVSALFGKRRPLPPVMLQLQEELGELSTEVAIATGTKRRTPSEDGVAGEAVDVAIVALDIAMLETGGDIEAIKAIFERKLAKWESYK